MSLDTDLSPLLHNMSTPPKTVVKFEGLGGLARRRDTGGSGIAPLGYAGQQTFGTPVRFVLPPEWHRLKAPGILRKLDPESNPSSPEARELRIALLIEQRAAELPLPEGCVVIAAHETHPVLWDDGLTALAILAKCTDTVWLRGKTPSLASAFERGTVSLLVPPAFSDRLPAAPPPTPAQHAIGESHEQ
jgi:hypothetical protein